MECWRAVLAATAPVRLRLDDVAKKHVSDRGRHSKRMQKKMGTDVRLGINSSTGTSFTPKMTLAGEMSSCNAAPAAANCESVNTR